MGFISFGIMPLLFSFSNLLSSLQGLYLGLYGRSFNNFFCLCGGLYDKSFIIHVRSGKGEEKRK